RSRATPTRRRTARSCRPPCSRSTRNASWPRWKNLCPDFPPRSQATMNGKPTPAFYVVLGVVVVALVAFAIWRLSPRPSTTGPGGPDIVMPYQKGQRKKELEPGDSGSLDPEKIGLTEKKVEWKPAERLPPVPGVSAYTPLDKTDNTVVFAINVWAGWAPIVL